ncbi:hypothetical protein ACWD25_42805 [Streptomyces sp. NPDC002920]
MERRSCADGAMGPRACDFAVVGLADTLAGLKRTLLIRRSTVPNKKNKKAELVREVACFLCHHTPGTTPAELVIAAGQRWMVEETFQAAKNEVGFDQHEVRKWCSWYRQRVQGSAAVAGGAAEGGGDVGATVLTVDADARLRRPAMMRGRRPMWILESSSRKVRSRTWCRAGGRRAGRQAGDQVDALDGELAAARAARTRLVLHWNRQYDHSVTTPAVVPGPRDRLRYGGVP